MLDLVLDQPVGQTTQIGRRRADLQALEVEVVIDFDVGDHDRQHLLVDVNSRDPVASASPGERRACLVASFRVASYRRYSVEESTTLNYSVNHAGSGSNSCAELQARFAARF